MDTEKEYQEENKIAEKSIFDEKMSRREFLQMSVAFLGAVSLSRFPVSSIISLEDDIAVENSSKDLSVSARSFVARTKEEAFAVSELLREKGTGPNNICGPLSIAIMMDWRMADDKNSINCGDNPINSGIAPSDMWLASPKGESTSRTLFSSTFPEEKYYNYRITESTKKLNFDNIPEFKKLKSGDFLFLTGGSFAHFVTVSKVDKTGKVFATSNIHTDKLGEFIIDEIILWDPETKNGYFRKWAEGVGPSKATTGLFGFYLWRKKEIERTKSYPENHRDFKDLLTNKMLNEKRGAWNINISELNKDTIFEWRDGILYNPGPTMDIAIAELMMQEISKNFEKEIKSEGLSNIMKKSYFGFSFDELLTRMLAHSDERAVDICCAYLSKSDLLNKHLERIGMKESSIFPKRSSQRDILQCYRDIVSCKYIDKGSRDYILDKLSTNTSNDGILINSLKKYLPSIKIWNKKGTVIDNNLLTVQDTGIIRVGEKYYYVGISGTSTNKFPAKDSDLREIIEDICKDFYYYILSKNNNVERNRDKLEIL